MDPSRIIRRTATLTAIASLSLAVSTAFGSIPAYADGVCDPVELLTSHPELNSPNGLYARPAGFDPCLTGLPAPQASSCKPAVAAAGLAQSSLFKGMETDYPTGQVSYIWGGGMRAEVTADCAKRVDTRVTITDQAVVATPYCPSVVTRSESDYSDELEDNRLGNPNSIVSWSTVKLPVVYFGSGASNLPENIGFLLDTVDYCVRSYSIVELKGTATYTTHADAVVPLGCQSRTYVVRATPAGPVFEDEDPPTIDCMRK